MCEIRIGCINGNKRLGSQFARERLDRWLLEYQPHLLLLQEPFALRAITPLIFSSYGLNCATGYSAVYSREIEVAPLHISLPERSLAVNVCGLTIFNTYLSPYQSAVRSDELRRLSEVAEGLLTSDLMFCGDFNLAPQNEDGIVDGRASQWTQARERVQLEVLKKRFGLIDVLSANLCGTQHFTVERSLRGRDVKFRCDFALLTQGLAERSSCSYDHSVRIGPEPWTDHSAIRILIEDGISSAT